MLVSETLYSNNVGLHSRRIAVYLSTSNVGLTADFMHLGWQVDELFSINYLTLIWNRPVTNGGPPSCRDGHAAAFDGTHR